MLTEDGFRNVAISTDGIKLNKPCEQKGTTLVFYNGFKKQIAYVKSARVTRKTLRSTGLFLFIYSALTACSDPAFVEKTTESTLAGKTSGDAKSKSKPIPRFDPMPEESNSGAPDPDDKGDQSVADGSSQQGALKNGLGEDSSSIGGAGSVVGMNTSTSVCPKSMVEIFGNFVLKGGKSLSLQSQLASLPGQEILLTFKVGSLLSLEKGILIAADAVVEETFEKMKVEVPQLPVCNTEVVVKLIPSSTFVSSKPAVRGLKGNLYRLPSNTERLPDLSKMSSIGKVYISEIDVAVRRFSEGFPGVVGDLFEWFAIDFEGKLKISSPGKYSFRVVSDDGSLFYLNGALIVNNDGVHGVKTVDSASLDLMSGTFPIRLSYFQGPRFSIALQLFYQGPGVTEWTIVPQSMLSVD